MYSKLSGLSLQRLCLFLTICNTAVIVFMTETQNIVSVIRLYGANISLSDDVYLPDSSWEGIVLISTYILLLSSIIMCFYVLVITSDLRRHNISRRIRGRIWLSIANLIVLVSTSLVAHLSR